MVKKQSNQKLIAKLYSDLVGYISLKGLNQDDFFNDIWLVKTKQIKDQDFIKANIELFDGTIRKFTSVSSFLGSIRRLYNTGKKSKYQSIKDFSIVLKLAYIEMDLTQIQLKFHKFKKYISSGKTGNFKNREKYFWTWKTKAKGQKFFENGGSNPNWNIIEQMIIYDIGILSKSLKVRLNQKAMFGFSQFFDLYLPNAKGGNYFPSQQTGKKTGICFNKKTLQMRFGKCMNDSNFYFNISIAKSGTYFIYQSTIIVYIYTF